MTNPGEAQRAERKDILRSMFREIGYAVGVGQPGIDELAELLWPYPVKRLTQPAANRLKIIFDRPLTMHEVLNLSRSSLFETAAEAEYRRPLTKLDALLLSRLGVVEECHDDAQEEDYAMIDWPLRTE